MRLWLIALLVGCGADDVTGRNAHNEVACPSSLPNADTCELACVEIGQATAERCQGWNPITSNTVVCQEIHEFDGTRGCCSPISGGGVYEFRFFACD